MEPKRGTLYREQMEGMPVAYIAHGQGCGDQPRSFELRELQDALVPNEIVSLVTVDGRKHVCQVVYAKNERALIATL